MLTRLDLPVLDDRQMFDLVHPLMNAEREIRFEQAKESTPLIPSQAWHEFRVNIFRQQGHIGAVLRVIPFDIRTIDELGLPPVSKQLANLPPRACTCDRPYGKWQVNDTSGDEKSISINESRPGHIITIEDPIEYVHRDKQCAVNQREVE